MKHLLILVLASSFSLLAHAQSASFGFGRIVTLSEFKAEDKLHHHPADPTLMYLIAARDTVKTYPYKTETLFKGKDCLVTRHQEFVAKDVAVFPLRLQNPAEASRPVTAATKLMVLEKPFFSESENPEEFGTKPLSVWALAPIRDYIVEFKKGAIYTVKVSGNVQTRVENSEKLDGSSNFVKQLIGAYCKENAGVNAVAKGSAAADLDTTDGQTVGR